MADKNSEDRLRAVEGAEDREDEGQRAPESPRVEIGHGRSVAGLRPCRCRAYWK